MLAAGAENRVSTTNFDDIDEEDKAGKKTRLFKSDGSQGYLDVSSLDAASLDKVWPSWGRRTPESGGGAERSLRTGPPLIRGRKAPRASRTHASEGRHPWPRSFAPPPPHPWA